MNILNLKLTGFKSLEGVTVLADGNPVKLKQNEFNNSVACIDTEKDRIKIEVYRALDVGGIWWFLTQVVFFLISVFGIFDIYSKNRFLGVQFESEIRLAGNNNLTLKGNTPLDKARAVEIETDAEVNVSCNAYYVDVKAKKTLKALKITKILLAFAIIAVVAAVLIIKII